VKSARVRQEQWQHGAAGAVAYMFHKKGDIIIAKSAAKEDI